MLSRQRPAGAVQTRQVAMNRRVMYLQGLDSEQVSGYLGFQNPGSNKQRLPVHGT